MYCSNCGVKNDSTNKFCINCGNNLMNEVVKNKSGYEETSMILGIICLISSFIVNIFCFIPGIISIVYAKKYKKESGRLGNGFGLSLAGMILSIIMLLLWVLLFLFIIGISDSVPNTIDTSGLEFTNNLITL